MGASFVLAGITSVPQPGIGLRVLRVLRGNDGDDQISVFNYLDTASTLRTRSLASLGTGGTGGGYILDLVAKTPVREIRLFDDDDFLSHNAFRVSGAPSLEELRDAPNKVHYLKGIYERMHLGIVAHCVKL